MPPKPRPQVKRRGELTTTSYFPIGRYKDVEIQIAGQNYSKYPRVNTYLLAEIYDDVRDEAKRIAPAKKRVWYWRMQAWQVNNMLIGYEDRADGVDGNKIDWSLIELDPWLKCEKRRIAIHTAVVQEHRHPKRAAYLTGRHRRPDPTPPAPIHEDGEFVNRRPGSRPQRPQGGVKELDVIAMIKLDIDNAEEMESVDHLILATFGDHESLDDIKTFFRSQVQWKPSEPDRAETRLGLNAVLTHSDWDLEIWVLPQRQNNRHMYNWGMDGTAGFKVWHFLEHAHDEARPYHEPLYIEVRVIPKPAVPSQEEEPTPIVSDDAQAPKAGKASQTGDAAGRPAKRLRTQ